MCSSKTKDYIGKMRGLKSCHSGSHLKYLVLVTVLIGTLMFLAYYLIWGGDKKARFPDVLLHDPGMCREFDYLDWVFLATSAAENYNRRRIIRKTYGNMELFKTRRFKLIFFIGKSGKASVNNDVIMEFHQYRDIVVGDFVDSFRNSSLKLMLGLNWISEHCNKSPYFIKLNDDTFVNMFEVGTVLDETSITKNFIRCSVLENKHIMRFKDDMEYCRESGICVEEEDLVGFTKYPKFCHGAMFVFSNDLLQRLLDAMDDTVFFWQGDVYVTGLVPRRMAIRYVDISRSYAEPDQMLEQYRDPTVEINHYFAQVKDSDLFEELWMLLMKRRRSHAQNK